MNVMAHILVVFLVIAGNIFGASSGVEDFVPQPPETHKRFFSLVTSKSVIMNCFITVKESSYHGFSDGSAVTILECMYDDPDEDEDVFKLLVVSVKDKTFYLFKKSDLKVKLRYQKILFQDNKSKKLSEEMPSVESFSFIFNPLEKLEIKSIISDSAKALDFIEKQEKIDV